MSIYKIAIEEHFLTEETSSRGNVESVMSPAAQAATLRRLLELGEERIAEMDAAGIDVSVLSLRTPGLQAVTDPSEAVGLARRTNDLLAETVEASSGRFAGFASLPTVDPAAAAAELERAVVELGMRGTMINGYTNVADSDDGRYLDDASYSPLWERAEGLNVPIYIHPRRPLPGARRPYEGFPDLEGAAWGYGVETATHALRLIRSGLFDRFPAAQVILGHLGESLPFNLWRLDNRLRRSADGVRLERSITEYFQQNFFVTTSGQCRLPVLLGVLTELGADRVLFATDHPFEDMRLAASWLDELPMSEVERVKIASGNSAALLGLET